MITVGEQTGALPQMLNSVSEFFEEDVATALAAALALIEPAILIVMGVVVVFILISLYLPIFSLGQANVTVGGCFMAETEPRYQRYYAPLPLPRSRADERANAEALARRYHAEFVDLKNFKIQHELCAPSPSSSCSATTSCPSSSTPDALGHRRQRPLAPHGARRDRRPPRRSASPRVATLSQITDLLKKTEQSQRVLDEASEGLTFDVLTGDENSDENISIEKLTSEEDISPIIRLVDTTIFTALERRASDIHIETYDDSVTSSTASTACCRKPWRPSPASTTAPSSAASRS
jgi:hypothetical protein